MARQPGAQNELQPSVSRAFPSAPNETPMYLGDESHTDMTWAPIRPSGQITQYQWGPQGNEDQDFIPDPASGSWVDPALTTVLLSDSEPEDVDMYLELTSDDRLNLSIDEADYAARQLEDICTDYMPGKGEFTTGQLSSWRSRNGDNSIADSYLLSINGGPCFLPELQEPGEAHDLPLEDRLIVDHVFQAIYSYASIDLGGAELDGDNLLDWWDGSAEYVIPALQSLKAAVSRQQFGTDDERHNLHSSVWWKASGEAAWQLSRGLEGKVVDRS